MEMNLFIKTVASVNDCNVSVKWYVLRQSINLFSLWNGKRIKYFAVVFDGTLFVMCEQHITMCCTY